DSIDFERAGMAETAAGYGVLFSNDTPKEVIEAYRVNNDGGLIHKQTGNAYDRKYPYVVISIDGTKNDSYAGFQQSTASAELLARFYNIGKDSKEPVGELLEGLQYYSDIKFRRKAAELEEQIKKFQGTDSAELDKLKNIHKALLANILTDELKPKT
ncbi:MAG: hypothetical protein ACOYLO_17540, partial [Ferruginibacter sp.]